MSDSLKPPADEQNLDQSYEYSVINATFDATSAYYPPAPTASHLAIALVNVDEPVAAVDTAYNNAFNNDYVQVNVKRDSFDDTASSSSSSQPPPKPPLMPKPVSRIICGTGPLVPAHPDAARSPRSSDPKPTDLDKLPPQIEISLYGSEVLPETSLIDSDSLPAVDSDKTPLATLECKGRARSKLKTRYQSNHARLQTPRSPPRCLLLFSWLVGGVKFIILFIFKVPQAQPRQGRRRVRQGADQRSAQVQRHRGHGAHQEPGLALQDDL